MVVSLRGLLTINFLPSVAMLNVIWLSVVMPIFGLFASDEEKCFITLKPGIGCSVWHS